jgi:hypothetical protein
MKLRSVVHDVASLRPGDRDAMFSLMEKAYANMQRSRFDVDLNAKQSAIIVRRPDNDCIVGFSTQALLELRVGETRVSALYSGDTVVDRSNWGDPALAHAWGNFALELIDRHCEGQGHLHWFLTSKGFRTYHYLPLFFRHYFPRRDVITPSTEKSIIDALGDRIGGDRYDAERGIIHADGQSDFVRPEIAGLTAQRKVKPHAHFFTDRNPHFARGDELCCLAKLSRENFTRAAYRVIRLPRVPVSAV